MGSYLKNYKEIIKNLIIKIKMLTPNQAHQRTGQLKRVWKNYYKNKTLNLVN